MPQTHTSGPRLLDSGTRAVSVQRGTFHCPSCRARAAYRYITVGRTIRIVGVDVLPARRASEYVECLSCAGTFITEVLNPESRLWNLKPLHLQAGLRVMLLMMLADGAIDDAEIDRIIEVYERIGGERMHRSAVLTQAGHARADTRDPITYLRDIGLRLNESGKLKVFQGAYEVAAADGVFQQEEQVLLQQLIEALGLRADPYQTLGVSPPAAHA